MSVKVEYGGGDYFGLRFPYHRHFVRCVHGLNNRRWDPAEKCWYIHISHLPEVMQLFQISRGELPKKLWRAYQIYRIRTSRLRIHVGTTTARIEGDRFPVEEVVQCTSYLVPGHQFTPAFQEGRWDGRRCLFDRRHQTFPAGLINRIVDLFQSRQCHFEVVHDPLPPLRGVRYHKPTFELRDYQEECVKAALKAKRGVLELATGAGKTLVAAKLIYELGLPALFFVHTRDLLYQTHEFFREQLYKRTGIVGDGQIKLGLLTVATLQTVARVLEIPLPKSIDEEEMLEEDSTEIASGKERLRKFLAECPVVFFDECHHLPAETFYALAMLTTGAYYRFGLSATPYRADKLDILLEAAVGPKAYRANASVLIEKGYLVPPEIIFLAPSASHTVPSRTLDYATVYHEYIVTNPERNGMIVREARKLAKQGKSVLVLVSQVAHGERLHELMPEAAFVQGSDSATKRRRVFAKLESKTQPIVIATTLADEGLDVPSLDAVILASGGKSETRALQRIGRALRPAPNKTKATIIDFFDNAPFLKEHSMRRYEIYETEPQFTIRTVGFEA